MSIRQWKAATVQSEPRWLDKEAGVSKAIQLIREAKAGGASLIAFPELWLPGYPIFIWSNLYTENIELVQKYALNSISAHGPEMLAVRRAAAESGIYVGLGFSERDGASLYMAQVLIGPDGAVLMHRRKIKPTHMERTMFGEGSGDSLRNVVSTPLGKIGMLNCWEHVLPLLKFNTFSQGEEVHIAAWPNNRRAPVKEPWSLSIQATEIMASQMYAVEGGCYVLCANNPVSRDALERNAPEDKTGDDGKRWQRELGGGASAIYGPDGRQLTELTDPTFDGLIYCDIDLDLVYKAKAVLDTVGHYTRPELLRLVVDDRPKTVVSKAYVDAKEHAATSTLLSRHKPLAELAEIVESRREKAS